MVYEAGGFLYQLNVTTGRSSAIVVQIDTMSAQRRPQWKDASKTITSTQLSATGQRALISARGEIFTLPLKEGSSRNLTQSSGVREFDALWRPDGQQLAYLSDQGGQHSIRIACAGWPG